MELIRAEQIERIYNKKLKKLVFASEFVYKRKHNASDDFRWKISE